MGGTVSGAAESLKLVTGENQGSRVLPLVSLCNDYACEQIAREAVIRYVVQVSCNTALNECVDSSLL